MNAFGSRSDLLKALVLYADADERRCLLERMDRAERDERSSRQALVIATLVAVICCVGLSFLSVEVLADLEDASLALLDAISGLAAFSAFVLMVVAGCWLWNRDVMRRIQLDAARFVLGLVENRTRAREEGRSMRQGLRGSWENQTRRGTSEAATPGESRDTVRQWPTAKSQ